VPKTWTFLERLGTKKVRKHKTFPLIARQGGELVSPPQGPLVTPHSGRHYRPNGTDRLTLVQAGNLMEAVAFASEIGLPLRAHLTVR